MAKIITDEEGKSLGDAQAIIRAMVALHGAEVTRIGHGDAPQEVMVLPAGMRVESIKKHLDEYASKPERRTGTAVLGDLDSFIAHTNRFKDAGSIVYANRSEEKPSLLSVLDYHPAGEDNTAARFGQHRGSYRFPTSEQWDAWRRVDGTPLSQAAFATFLEERIMDILPPPTDGRSEAGALALDLVSTLGGEIAGPARLLEVARGLKMKEQSEVTNAQNINTGEIEIVFKTTHSDAAGAPLKVPNLFLVGVPVFDGDAAYKLPIRLQYRRQEGRLLWTIRRYRPELIFFHAFDAATVKVATGTGLPLLIGTPEA